MEAEFRPEPGPRRLSKEELSSLIDTLRQQGLSKEQIMDVLRKSGLYTPEEPAQGLTPGKGPPKYKPGSSSEPGLVDRWLGDRLAGYPRRTGKGTRRPLDKWQQSIIDEITSEPFMSGLIGDLGPASKVTKEELDIVPESENVQPEHKLTSPHKPSPKKFEASTAPLSVSTSERHRFLSFNPFEGVDTGLRYEEKARPSRKEAAILRRLAGHFARQTSEIESLLNKAKAHPEKEQYYTREAGVLSCATLQEVSEARHLREGIRLLARTRKHHLDVDAIASVITYIEEFFEQEERLLVELGVSGDRATEIIADCRKVFEDVRSGQAPRGRIFEAITRVTDATCDLAERLREQAIQERERERAKKILKTASKAIGGTAVVALNARILATPGLQAVAVFSGVLGAGLIEAAAQEL